MAGKNSDSNKKNILIVEDDPSERELYQEILKDKYNIKQAKNGEEALKKIAPNTDLILLDRKMPGITGDEVLEKIRNHENQKIRDIPVIMLTALDAGLDIINMKFEDYLNKPTSPQELRKKIKKTLSVSKYHKDLDEYYSLINKKNILQETLTEEELSNEDYKNLEKRVERKREEINEEITDIMDNTPLEATEEFQKFLEKIIGSKDA